MARILVVEDDLWSRRLVFDLLVLRGHDVLCAAGVLDGRAQLDSVRFDAVLLDINIPGGGGELLLQEIREYNAIIPVIAFTASTMAGDRERFLAEGFTAHLSKPIDVASFAETVESYLLPPA
jgi:two-component system sensor histidine kinase/response regulator